MTDRDADGQKTKTSSTFFFLSFFVPLLLCRCEKFGLFSVFLGPGKVQKWCNAFVFFLLLFLPLAPPRSLLVPSFFSLCIPQLVCLCLFVCLSQSKLSCSPFSECFSRDPTTSLIAMEISLHPPHSPSFLFFSLVLTPIVVLSHANHKKKDLCSRCRVAKKYERDNCETKKKPVLHAFPGYFFFFFRYACNTLY
ncbi:hypothetical protein EDB86DRAFT_2932380 [Lactarius hatsudake]|nr:hypothetical protein EDB86DRAFT_2932380 [Lactarius hatsudake]